MSQDIQERYQTKRKGNPTHAGAAVVPSAAGETASTARARHGSPSAPPGIETAQCLAMRLLLDRRFKNCWLTGTGEGMTVEAIVQSSCFTYVYFIYTSYN
jgi:hypothetical protein